MRRRKTAERDLHRAVVKYLALALPADALFFHVPNGGWRSKPEGALLRAMGVLAGVFDLVIVYRGRALFIELKGSDGRASDAQVMFLQKARHAGADGRFCRSLGEVQAALDDWHVPLSARMAA